MTQYGLPVPASRSTMKDRVRRNLTPVGLLIVVGMAALALTHVQVPYPARAPSPAYPPVFLAASSVVLKMKPLH